MQDRLLSYNVYVDLEYIEGVWLKLLLLINLYNLGCVSIKKRYCIIIGGIIRIETDSEELVNRKNTSIMKSTRQFCRTSILREPEVSFDFDVSTITEENLGECIQKISGELFRQRPMTEPYVRALMMFGSYLHWKLHEQSWYHVDLLLDAMVGALENAGFNPPISIFDWIKLLVNSIL